MVCIRVKERESEVKVAQFLVKFSPLCWQPSDGGVSQRRRRSSRRGMSVWVSWVSSSNYYAQLEAEGDGESISRCVSVG